MNITQLDFFEDATTEKGKRGGLKPIDYSSPVGMYKELKDVEGVNLLTDKALDLLQYLYVHHAQETDGFIHANQLAHLLGYMDTRELRKLCAEIDTKTELVIYASQHGYKLAASQIEMREAIKFALAPAMTSIRRVFAKNKQETLHWLHGFLGNLEKEFGGVVQGQLQHDDTSDDNTTMLREVNHFPKQTFKEYVAPVEDRIKDYENEQKQRQISGKR